jgi:hypothetical protein
MDTVKPNLSLAQHHPSQKICSHRPFDGLFAASLRYWSHAPCMQDKRNHRLSLAPLMSAMGFFSCLSKAAPHSKLRGGLTHAHLRAVDLKPTPLTTRANWLLPASSQCWSWAFSSNRVRLGDRWSFECGAALLRQGLTFRESVFEEGDRASIPFLTLWLQPLMSATWVQTPYLTWVAGVTVSDNTILHRKSVPTDPAWDMIVDYCFYFSCGFIYWSCPATPTKGGRRHQGASPFYNLCIIW